MQTLAHSLSLICAQCTHVHTEGGLSASGSSNLPVELSSLLLYMYIFRSSFTDQCNVRRPGLPRRHCASGESRCGTCLIDKRIRPEGSGAQKLRCAKQEAVIGRPGDSTRQKHQATSLNDSTRNVHQTAMVDERLRFSSAEPSGFPVGIKPNERDTNFHFPFHLHSTVFTVEVPARCTKPYLPSPHVG